jgi:hypothetical protein
MKGVIHHSLYLFGIDVGAHLNGSVASITDLLDCGLLSLLMEPELVVNFQNLDQQKQQ